MIDRVTALLAAASTASGAVRGLYCAQARVAIVACRKELDAAELLLSAQEAELMRQAASQPELFK